MTMSEPKSRKTRSRTHKRFGIHSRMLEQWDLDHHPELRIQRRRIGDKQILPGEYGHPRTECRTRAELRNDAEREHEGGKDL